MTIDVHTQMRLSITGSADGSADYVQILGDVDLSDSRALRIAAAQLIDAAASTIYVDLAGTTFMGSTLVAFLVHIGNDSRTERPLVLCRPTPMARRVIAMTCLDELATVRPDLPPQWPAPVHEPMAALRAV
jgi:anti-anti-sigma factor